MTWLVPRSGLTPQQLRAAELSAGTHRLIAGPPGSGKTMVLLHRARYLIDGRRVSPDRYRVLMFTNALKSYVQSAIEVLALPAECVMTFDAWCREFHATYIGPGRPGKATDDRSTRKAEPDFEAIRRMVWEAIKAGRSDLPLYDFVLVDEGQDLDELAYRILAAVAAHVTVFMDHKQQLYEDGADEAAVLRALGLRKRNLTLLDAYRCSPYIVRVAAAFVPDEGDREDFVAQNAPRDHGSRRTPVLYLADGHQDLREDLYETVRSCVAANERIAILLPTRRHVFGYAKGMVGAGFDVEVPPQRGKRKAIAPPHDFASARPKLMAYPSAKGLTFDSVLMPGLRPRDLPKTTERAERWLFVGITRATRWAYFSGVGGDCMFGSRFEALEREGQVTVRRPDVAPPAPVAEPAETPNLSDLF